MKTSILVILAIFSLAACKKDEKIKPKITPPTPVVDAVNPDTIPAKAAFRIKLTKDSTDSNETMLVFNQGSKLNYSAAEDAAYLPGFGQVGLASISNDGKYLSINSLPYTSGMAVGLDVEAKTDGSYSLKISFENKIPGNVQIWVKDTYLKDSVNVCSGNYNFNVAKADSATFGSKRFKLVIKTAAQQQVQTGAPN